MSTMSVRRFPSTYARDRSSPQQKSPQQNSTQKKKTPAELVTYRMDDEMIYVEPARDYDQALEYARSAFPTLATFSNSRIAFFVNVRVSGSLRKVRIAPMAWPRVMKSLATYEIVDLAILPKSTITIDPQAAKSETLLSKNTITCGDNNMPPPKYGNSSSLVYSSSMDHNEHRGYRDSDKSPYFTLHVSDAEQLLPPPSLPSVKRGTSAFSWFTKHLQLTYPGSVISSPHPDLICISVKPYPMAWIQV